jgi:hypothetical protein
VADPAGGEEVTAEQLVELIRGMKVSDLLLSTLATVAQIGYAKLEPSSRDLGEARLAIEALRALLPVLKEAVPVEATRDYQQVIANLQLAYARAVDEEAGRGKEEAPATEPEPSEPPNEGDASG